MEQEVGLKEFQRRYGDYGFARDLKNSHSKSSDPESVGHSEKKTQKRKKSAEKWEPVEMSSKVKTKKFACKSPQISTKIRDPRFDDLSGEYNEKEFEKGYAFLKEIEAEDERNLKKFVKVSEQEEMVEDAKRKLKNIKRLSREKTNGRKIDEKMRTLKKAELAAVKEGKKPFFLKKSERKKLALAEKFKELKQSGKLEKYMEKKRKRNAAKLKKALPE